MATKAEIQDQKQARQARFIAFLLEGLTPSEAAGQIGVHRRTVYDWRDQSAGFRANWEDAVKESKERLLDKYQKELYERALDRSDKNSHILLIFLLKRLDPEYKENYKREVKIQHESVREIQINPEDLKTAFSILESASQRSQPKADIEAEAVEVTDDSE